MASKQKCAKCGKNVMHYDDRSIEVHKPPGKTFYCDRKTY